MTLAQLLGLNPRLLDSDEEEGLRLAERLFSEAGAPIDRRALYVVLENVIRRIHLKRDRGSSIRYPRFLYGKFKDLKRGLWEPQPGALIQMEQEERAAAAALSAPTVGAAREMLTVAEKARDTAAIAYWRQEIEKREASATATEQPSEQPARSSLGPQLVN